MLLEKNGQNLYHERHPRLAPGALFFCLFHTDEEFEELAEYIQDICTGPRRYADARHEVYSRLKHDMISYQYEKVLKKLK
jgi:hypothetical protein